MAERGYGWEKLVSEMFCQEYWAERGMKTFIARFHNVYGPNGTWDGGREKAPAAICRKVIEAKDSGSAHASRSGATAHQTRSFMYIDDCTLGIDRITHCEELIATPINLGSSELISDQRPGEPGRGDRRGEAAAGVQPRRPQGSGRPQQRQHDDPADPRLGAEHALPRRPGQDLRLDRPSNTRTARPASGRAGTRPSEGRLDSRKPQLLETADRYDKIAEPSPRAVARAAAFRDRKVHHGDPILARHHATIGEIPYRMAFAGGWIDQPFVSRLNPRPPGSMVVVGLEPTFRWMERSGMASGTPRRR